MSSTRVTYGNLSFSLGEPDYMEVRVVRQGLKGIEYEYVCDWNEACGFIRINPDGSEDSWEHGSKLILHGLSYRLPTESVCEKIIELLRLLKGVTY